MKHSEAYKLDFKKNGDENGYLVVVEGNRDIPFDIRRVFYIYGTQSGVVRGSHANRKSEFVLINVSGTSKVRVDYGNREDVFSLDKPNTGIYIPRMLWKDMYDFSSDSVLLVLASEPYDSSEYIRDKAEYYELIKAECGDGSSQAPVFKER